MAAASRFVDILLDNSVPEKTKKATKYGMKIFNGKYFFTRQNYELFYKFKTNPALLSSISVSNINYCHLFIIERFTSQTKFKTVIEEIEKEELNEMNVSLLLDERTALSSKFRP